MLIGVAIIKLLIYERKLAPFLDYNRFPLFTTNWAPAKFYLTIGTCEYKFVLIPPTKSNGNTWQFFVDDIQKYLLEFQEYYKMCIRLKE